MRSVSQSLDPSEAGGLVDLHVSYNILSVHPYLTQEAAQVLIQALVFSRLDYCNSLLAGFPSCAIKSLQLIQNAAARLVFNLPKFSHVTPLLHTLHWLPVEARIHCKTIVLAYGAARGTAPPNLQAMQKPYTPTSGLGGGRSLVSQPPDHRTVLYLKFKRVLPLSL